MIRIRERLRRQEWTLKWSGHDFSALADAAAKFTALNGVSLFCDEFSVGNLPQLCLEVVLRDKLCVGL